jgi:hypothetical protein
MKTILCILSCIAIYGSGAATGFVSVRVYRNYAIKAPIRPLSNQTTVDIPSIRQIQQRLKATGKKRYDPGKIDGKISLTGQTQKAWNNFTKDKFAIKTFKPEYYEVDK